MPLVLGQVVGDREPGRLGADEDVVGRADGRGVDQRAQGDMDPERVTHDRVEQGAALAAVGIVGLVAAVDQQAVGAFGDRELRPLDTCKWLEGRAGGARCP